ncbi:MULTISPECIES: MarR family transcriptional regulator [Pseudomonas]|jgi:MarR family transcriptional repressor of mexAB-oprM operon|uniref:MarR family transcriptional regulator n=1 Tax=Pseudomonas citronellolis TaxID=53408 RepID=A0AAW6P2Q5_9PSED|nr:MULTISPECIES: MarR family transcriptional regulator [Pseudomonas]KSW24576.1 MarR family transcriptional regulator [Pseudomonas sp. ADP]AMO74072.1 Multidrug resistance operon repressor [Pseudomonas citronellolis]KES23969.1 MarR family transcriptional regulator [Pseudomonas sp. AAC]KRV81302.1 MarR family transcriptional regulator [Pseudomonas citronellolis]KRW76179.1 MarR family transcriptional regulator [Pseudomonas citronellolis]
MTRPVNPDLPENLMALFEHLRNQLQMGLLAQGIDLAPPDIRLLELIAEAEGLINLQDVGRQMCRDKALITRKVREMESRGLVRRERNPGDQRSFQLFLTEAGKVVHAQAQAILACTHDRLFAPLDAEEQRCMAHLLQRCLDAQEELPQ